MNFYKHEFILYPYKSEHQYTLKKGIKYMNIKIYMYRVCLVYISKTL